VLCGRLGGGLTTAAASLGAVFPLIGVRGPSAPERPATPEPTGRVAYFNPVFGRIFPDPSVLRVGREYYAYATTPGKDRRKLFPILRSRNLIHWREAGFAFDSPPSWGYARWWAPSVMRHRGRYYMFYSGHARRPNKMCVAVATASSPLGPFRHRARLACAGAGGSIDPAPARVGKDVYLYFARTSATCKRVPGRCLIVGMKLSDDLLRARGRPTPLVGIDHAWERSGEKAAVENPALVIRGGQYYLLYSGGDWQHSYGMGYAVSRSPLGPFVKPESRPFLRGRRGLYGPGGGSAVSGPRGDLWLVYHARRQDFGYPADRRRSLHLDRLLVGGGRVHLEGPTLRSSVAP